MCMWNKVNCIRNHYANVRTSSPYNHCLYPKVSCPHHCTYRFYFQVVRYHSLVIEPGSLPDDLISIAWTASPNLLSYLESDRTNVSTFLGSLDNNFMAVSLEHSISGRELSNISNGNASESDGSRVIMAIKQSSRPHYGVQVF